LSETLEKNGNLTRVPIKRGEREKTVGLMFRKEGHRSTGIWGKKRLTSRNGGGTQEMDGSEEAWVILKVVKKTPPESIRV